MPITRRRRLVFGVLALVAVAIGTEISTTNASQRLQVIEERTYFEQRCTFDQSGDPRGCRPTDEALRELCGADPERFVRRIEIIPLGRALSRVVLEPELSCEHLLLID